MPSKELEKVINMIKSRELEENRTIEEMRAGSEEWAKQFPVAPNTECKPIKIGNIDAEWIINSNAKDDRVLLFLHGGGYLLGSINTHRALASDISQVSQAKILLIAYRLAPEHPYPAAVEDCKAAYRWLLKEGYNPSRIVVAGDSAGGGLAVAICVALRDEGVKLPAAIVCLSPWIDMEAIGESMTTNAEVDPSVQRGPLLEMAKVYLGVADLRTPLANPLYANLKKLPPILIQVGTRETLLDDSTRLAEVAKKAGVEVILEPWEDMIHVWHRYSSILPEGKAAIERVGKFILQHTG
ncbi:MAG: alpha/beta hydrolase [Promethearchaeota archaeon]